MMNRTVLTRGMVILSCWCVSVLAGAAEPTSLAGRQWTKEAPRDEVRPSFTVAAQSEALALSADIEGADGWWQTEVPITGGQTYSISIQRQLAHVTSPHRSCVVRIDWLDDKNRRVPSARPFVKGILEGYNDMQQPDYLNEPQPTTTGAAAAEWQTLSGTYLSPPTAVKARIELHLRWCPVGASVQYRDFKVEAVKPVPPRLVKLATVHLQPRGGKPQANREAFVDVITQAAQAGAHLIVLPETLPYYGTGMTPLETAESVPGPTSEFFGALAKKLKVHIVATCFEKDAHQLFNTAILLGPDGSMIGPLPQSMHSTR